MKKILAAVDFSSATVRVCAEAARLAKSLGARLVLLHAVPCMSASANYHIPMQSRIFSTIDRRSHRLAASKMKALQKWFAKRWPDTRMSIHDGVPAEVILRTARMTEPECIVIGSHGHTTVYDLLVGSTAHAVLRRSRWPVLLIPIGTRRRARGY